MRSKKILIIDDEFELCLLLKLHLAGKGHEVEISYNLKDGLLKLNAFHPDIIFLDNNLPDGYGWENASNIINEHPFVKINLISGIRPIFPADITNENIRILEKPL